MIATPTNIARKHEAHIARKHATEKPRDLEKLRYYWKVLSNGKNFLQFLLQNYKSASKCILWPLSKIRLPVKHSFCKDWSRKQQVNCQSQLFERDAFFSRLHVLRLRCSVFSQQRISRVVLLSSLLQMPIQEMHRSGCCSSNNFYCYCFFHNCMKSIGGHSKLFTESRQCLISWYINCIFWCSLTKNVQH